MFLQISRVLISGIPTGLKDVDFSLFSPWPQMKRDDKTRHATVPPHPPFRYASIFNTRDQAVPFAPPTGYFLDL